MDLLDRAQAYRRSQSLNRYWRSILDSNWLWNLLASGFPFIAYLRTLAPTVYGLDSAELTTGAYVLGIVHAPGSPFYMIVGHLFSWLPIGDVGYRLNLMSAVAIALMLLFVFQIGCHLIRSRLISLAATWFLAFTYYIWSAALYAELYALQGAFTAALILLALKWHDQGRPWQLLTFMLVLGLGLGNHLSLMLLIPGFAILILSTTHWNWRNWHLLFSSLALGLLGLSIYVYLPLSYSSSTPMNYALEWDVDLSTLRGIWWMMTGRMFESLFFAVPLKEIPAEGLAYSYQLWSNFLGLGLLMALFGLITDFKKRPSIHIALLSMVGVYLVFYLSYRVGDKELMFLPTFLVWAIWLIIGANSLTKWLAERSKLSYQFLIPVVLLVLVAGAILLNFQLVDISEDWSARELGETIFAELDDNALYIGTWRDVPILEYLQLVEGVRTDVSIVNLFFVGADGAMQEIDSALADGLPTYTSVSVLATGDNLKIEHLDLCPCFRLRYDR